MFNQMKKTLVDVVHEMADNLYEAGVINAVTMRDRLSF